MSEQAKARAIATLNSAKANLEKASLFDAGTEILRIENYWEAEADRRGRADNLQVHERNTRQREDHAAYMREEVDRLEERRLLLLADIVRFTERVRQEL